MTQTRFFTIFIVLFFIFSNTIGAQTNFKEEQSVLPFFKKISIDIIPETWYKNLDADFTFSSIAVGIPGNAEFPAGMKLESDHINAQLIKENEHAENLPGRISELIITKEKSSKTFSLYSGNYSGKIFIYLHFAPALNINYVPLKKRSSDSCEKPRSIPISTWRQGLPAPSIKPESTTPIEHVIIHHSAGSNSDTDYTRTVRNIYLYHTQSNGWDDIGYNYLVAPNGDIYDGRDPQGVAAHDYIRGAHFCGKNSNTMGICMLGDLTQKAPEPEAVESLKLMLAWKLKKDNLNPLDSILHPKNNPAAYMVGTIAGHRNGCATECPGDYMYALIPVIKEDVKRIIQGCGGLSGINNIDTDSDNTIKIYPNPASSTFIIENKSNTMQNLCLINMLGQTARVLKVNIGEKAIIDASHLPQGLYLLKSNDNRNSAATKVLIQH